MLADESAPQHAKALAESLGYAQGYAEELRRMLDGKASVDHDRACQLVQAIRSTILAASDDLDELDDVQQEIDAASALHAATDGELFSALGPPGECPPPAA
ncbi:hypothetical protein ABZV65_11675 [Streptomyces bauhiniae]|uniref:hypothetical protein n=1 Tax=Streptomyces bauhiniae TaxID=2340725 RepID=UPI0033BCDF80